MIWLAASVIFVAISTTVAFVLCLILGNLTPMISAISLLVGFVAASIIFLKLKPRISPLKGFSYFDWAMILFFVTLIG